jgi:hypothetical protein
MTLKSWAMPSCEMRSLTHGLRNWKLSSNGTNEYYLDYWPDAFPLNSIMGFQLVQPYGEIYDPVMIDSGTPGTLTPGTYAVGDNDGLSKDVLYVRLPDSSNPNDLDAYSLHVMVVMQPDTDSWVQSSANPSEYFCAATVYVPKLSECGAISGFDMQSLTQGIAGSLEPNQYDVQLSDLEDEYSLTVHIRLLDDVDPNTLSIMFSFEICGGILDPVNKWRVSDIRSTNGPGVSVYRYSDANYSSASVVTEEPPVLLLDGVPIPKAPKANGSILEIEANQWIYAGRELDGTSHDNVCVSLRNSFDPNYLKKDLIQIPRYNTLIDNTGFNQCVIISMLFFNQDSRETQVYIRIQDSDSNEKFKYVINMGANTTYALDRKLVLQAGDKLQVQSTTEYMSIHASGDQS